MLKKTIHEEPLEYKMPMRYNKSRTEEYQVYLHQTNYDITAIENYFSSMKS